jgi:hypothetical protein
MKNAIRATALNPATGTEHSVAFDSWSTNHVGVVVGAWERFKAEHGFEPDINKIRTWVG